MMINANNITKRFGSITAVQDLSCSIPSGSVYGLVGCNGAGKSTLLRLLCGVYRPSSGHITLNDWPVYDNAAAKSSFFNVPDELFFLPQSNINRMAQLYQASYPAFSQSRLKKLTAALSLDCGTKINTFSKGMKRQAATALALSCMSSYYFFDETFDGLDPVIRRFFKDIIYNDMIERNATFVITSHSLRELEDTCDHLAMLQSGNIIYESDRSSDHTSLYKLQLAFKEPCKQEDFTQLDVLDFSQTGSVTSLIIRGGLDKAKTIIQSMEPLLMEILPLSLEEIFIYETKARGYTFDSDLLQGE